MKLQADKFESKRACPGVNLKLTSKIFIIFNKACLCEEKMLKYEDTIPGRFYAKDCLDSVEMYTWLYG